MKATRTIIFFLLVTTALFSCSTKNTVFVKPYKDVYVLDTVGISISDDPSELVYPCKSLRFNSCAVICNPVVAEYGGAYFVFSEKDSPKDFNDAEFYFGSNSHIFCSDKDFNLNQNNLHLYKHINNDVSLYKFNTIPKCFLMLLINMDMFRERQKELITSPQINNKLYEIRECYFRVAYPIYF